MISVVICSRESKISESLFNSIKEKIGCDYELIIIDNSETKYTIASAYNIGLEKSKYDIICFIHDDIVFHSLNWGIKLFEIFKTDQKIGLVGIAGSRIKTKTPSSWWENNPKHWVMNLIQHFPERKEIKTISRGFENSSFEETVVIDGVFMGLRKDNCIRFNEKMSAFHNYDQSISIEYLKRDYKIGVTNEILLEHFSIGTKNKQWLLSNLNFYNYYSKYLPLAVNSESIKREDKLYNYFILINNFSKFNLKFYALKYWFLFFLQKPFSKKHLSILKIIFLN